VRPESELRRLVLTFTREGVEIRTLYRRRGQEGPGPNSKGRRREVEELTRDGLTRALEALGTGDVAICGTSGFTTREDVLLATTSPSEAKLVKGA
jgi:hypothetical protein